MAVSEAEYSPPEVVLILPSITAYWRRSSSSFGNYLEYEFAYILGFLTEVDWSVTILMV